MKLTNIPGALAIFFVCNLAEAQIWECKDHISGRTTITNTPAQNENLTCLMVNNDRVAFNKLDSRFFEAYIKEAVARKEQLLGLRTQIKKEQEDANNK